MVFAQRGSLLNGFAIEHLVAGIITQHVPYRAVSGRIGASALLVNAGDGPAVHAECVPVFVQGSL